MKISLDQFVERRKELMAKMLPNSIAIIPSASMKQRNSDVEYAFRQDSNFYYLTGFNEPDAVLLLMPGRLAGESVLFCRKRDKLMEIWNGYRSGPEGVVADYAMDEGHCIDEVDELLPELLNGMSRIYYSIGQDEALDQQVRQWLNSIRSKVRQGAVAPSELVMLDQLLNEMRLIKTDAEKEMMRQAGDISAQGHVKAMQLCKPGMMEYQLEAEILHHFTMQGCRQPAYSSIVGGGENACVLHYIENDKTLNDGDLVLIDAGCELDHYAGDITRTFPVNGRFSEEQKALYQLVLDAQKACIAIAKPGTLWEAVHEESVKVLTQGLIDLGLLTGSLEDEITAGGYRDFYMHRIGHWLGMDVHDVGDYKVDGEWRPLQPGMVMTVEPGLYIAPDNEAVDARWRGIGIRIEDDVLITETGCEILTASVPKEIEEIEALMAS
ncbi:MULTISPECIES: Xaa-Pro aminopeptidase [unclassified Neptuniibacter]|uniref:Xaa-Pro aminopeptidase n=1 Tax=unclassified Neptuniibacter TaxID=2630693 RepID=UPI000C3526F3|nr:MULTISPECIES: Xaa-Pro aminopeptidase [unclassified Neptuniibacter]MAY41784.1 Xaa-Pro aminopeptidase [Oceanospirillaceae bacterium]|tara:strand:- start:4347 stop:5660 length:1314 start_codon:yes stop_codon:yes gene_type:complete